LRCARSASMCGLATWISSIFDGPSADLGAVEFEVVKAESFGTCPVLLAPRHELLRQSHLFRKTPCHAPATVKSDSNVNLLAKDGYAVTGHRFAKPGHYLVRVERTNEQGQRATAHLQVAVEPESRGK